MEEKNITINDLAGMINKGFDGVDEKFDGMNQRFDGVNQRFDKVEDRLERIEKLLIIDHRRRIEKLEEEVKDLKGLLAVQ